ncbi:MAG TPA: DUF418 domain-containing protein [Roseococcus sp.]|jgi:uncharacterized protein|nr:DUF418 domain-containing protein [Roseococcus sp.]
MNAAPREIPLDALRGFALLGIILVNAPLFAASAFAPPEPEGVADVAALWLLTALAAAKFFPIFSFLFGYGVARQAMLGRGGAPFLRRLLGLFVLGALHATLLFFGDILMLYAVLGLALWLLRDLPPRPMLMLGSAVLLVGVGVQAGSFVAFADMGAQEVLGPGYLGTFAEVVGQRWSELPLMLPGVLQFNGPVAAAAFLFGHALARSGGFPPDEAGLARARRVARRIWPLAALGSLAVVPLLRPEVAPSWAWAGALVFSALAPPLAFGMGVEMLSWARRHPTHALTRLLATAGAATLSGYLLHSLILGAVFHGWGFGLYGQLGAAAVAGVAVLTFLLLTGLIALWRLRFRQGPAEALLRRFSQAGPSSGNEPRQA